MRVNVYAEEMTDRIEIVEKTVPGEGTFTGLRIYLEMPASYHAGLDGGMTPAKVGDTVQAQHLQAPFIHRPGDDDSSAVTFWGKKDLRDVLRKALEELDKHYVV